MARFRFRLQPVLEQRLGAERRHQKMVAQIQIEKTDLENQLREINGAIETEKADWRDRISGDFNGEARVDLRGARLQAGASISLIAEAQRLVLRLAGLHARSERARQELLEATTRRRAVELLREKYFEAWQGEQRRAESREMDDQNVMRFGRASRAGFSEVLR